MKVLVSTTRSPKLGSQTAQRQLLMVQERTSWAVQRTPTKLLSWSEQDVISSGTFRMCYTLLTHEVRAMRMWLGHLWRMPTISVCTVTIWRLGSEWDNRKVGDRSGPKSWEQRRTMFQSLLLSLREDQEQEGSVLRQSGQRAKGGRAPVKDIKPCK